MNKTLPFLSTFTALAASVCFMTAHLNAADPPSNALDFQMENITGKTVNLEQYLGKVVLIVNVASKCGYTPQYEGLQKIYDKYSSKGFTIVGFPCNNFGHQEPGTEKEILEFCQKNYSVTFPMMAKIDVKGESQAPLYHYLTTNPEFGGEIGWNFEKFLIDRKGNIIGHFRSKVTPESKELTGAIEAALSKDSK